MRAVVHIVLLAMTTGCAAAAIPIVAGGMIARKQIAAPGPTAAPESAARPVVTLPASPALIETTPAATELTADSTPALPPGAVSEDSSPRPAQPPFAAFAGYAVTASAQSQALSAPRLSALLDPDSLIGGAKRLGCKAQPLAVAIDLDPAGRAFDLADPPAAAAGLSEALTEIRAAGLTVFWTSALPVKEADRLYAVLRATGLDLDGTDRILLARKPGETAQERRLFAARDWCFVALAGDRPGDFEIAIDYLRDPDGPIAQAMTPLLGAGWFVIPNPID